MKRSLKESYQEIDRWAHKQSKCLVLDFELILSNPDRQAKRIRQFLGLKLDTERMAAVVQKRSPKCYPGLLEAEMIDRADSSRRD